MKLTDADKAELLKVLEKNGDTGEIYPEDVAIYLAGKRAGREDMRERAAKHVVESCVQIGCTAIEATGVVRRTRDALAAAIRALGVDDDA